MTMTDPIADMLTRLRNANVAHHDLVRMPSSKLKESLAAILLREGYIAGFNVVSDDKRPGRILEVTMKYAPTAPARSRACAAFPSPGFVSTLVPTSCPGCSVASVWPCCPPARVL